MASRNTQERIKVFLFFLYDSNTLLPFYIFRFMKIFLSFLICLLCPLFLGGHPIPDIPVIGSFERNGSASITIEVDPRCFAEDPEEVPFLQKEAFDKLSKKEKEELTDKARSLIQKTLKIKFGNGEWILPEFRYEFLTKEHETIILDGDIVLLRGFYERKLSSDVNSYQIKAMDSADYDIVFKNILAGIPQKRVNVLWPGEESFVLDLSAFFSAGKEGIAKVGTDPKSNVASDTASTFLSFLRKGFVHVLPEGLDHILFVIGLFLFSRKTKPLLLQVTTFTIAHTITIALASLNFLKMSPTIIEPLIALSIVYIAIENIYRKEYRHFRLISIFIFGLIHGLGFAGVSSLDPGSPSFVSELLGFTIGVDMGQIAVIFIFLSLLFILSGLEEKSRKHVLSPIGFNYFLFSTIALLLSKSTYLPFVTLILWFFALILFSSALHFEHQLIRLFGKKSFIRCPVNYQKLFVTPASIIIATIGAYWTIERIFF